MLEEVPLGLPMEILSYELRLYNFQHVNLD